MSDYSLNPKILAGILASEYIALAVLYGLSGDWRRMLYWIGATIITLVVTF